MSTWTRLAALAATICALTACGDPASGKAAGEPCVSSTECGPGLLCDLAASPPVCAMNATPIDAAEIDAPEVDAAELDAAEIDGPTPVDGRVIDAPVIDAPVIDAPVIDAPDIDATEIDAPDPIDAAPDA